MVATPTTINLQFRQCPACLEPLVLSDGRVDPVTDGAELAVWKTVGGVWCSMHRPGCRWFGARLPEDAQQQVLLGR